jgi:hypothetical protein
MTEDPPRPCLHGGEDDPAAPGVPSTERFEAVQLGIHETTFFRKVRRLGIELPETDGRSSSSKP